ncbi:MAG: hypothetical protein KJ749_07550, partial [Planctomycetes bacterium]|nr:hypothetical protein [Planctomycetota bacterium]
RARTLWEAKLKEDWKTVYSLEDPRTIGEAGEAEFVAWCQEHEPFRVHSYSVGDVLIEGDMGWVEVDCRTSVRKFAEAPIRDVHRWEKWSRIGGVWYPVPRKELDSSPASPAMRDVVLEARLRERFESACEARMARDWPRLYEMSDPDDHYVVSEPMFVDALEIVEYVSYEIVWVEVLGEQGRVRVAYTHKATDPSLTKMPPKINIVNEEWVLRDNEWYLDLAR